MLQHIKEFRRGRKTHRTHPSLGPPVHQRKKSFTRLERSSGQQEFDFSISSETSTTDSLHDRMDQILRTAPVAITSVLIGVSIAMLITSLTGYLDALFVQQSQTHGAITGGALIALAVGVSVPQRFAMWICISAWRRFLSHGSSSPIADALIHPETSDRPLYWMVLAVIALVSGVMAALIPLNLYMASSVYHWLHNHFVWSSIPLEILHTSISLITTLIPLGLMGVALSCVHHLSCPLGRWETRATGWLLIGVSAGILFTGHLKGQGISYTLLIIASSLPAFLVALISSGVSSSDNLQLEPPVHGSAFSLPLWSDRWPRLLRVAIVAVGGGSACGVIVWSTPVRGELSSNVLSSAMILALGVGVLIACKTKNVGFRSIGGFGVASALAGVVVASASAIVNSSDSSGYFMYLVPSCLGLMMIGYVTAYGRKTLLARVASKSTTGTQIMSRLLVCAALTAWIGAPVMLSLMGTTATLVMLALSMIALGGLLIIYEPAYSLRTRRIRLLVIFGSISTMILLAALPSNPWGARSKPLSTTLKISISNDHSLSLPSS